MGGRIRKRVAAWNECKLSELNNGELALIKFVAWPQLTPVSSSDVGFGPTHTPHLRDPHHEQLIRFATVLGQVPQKSVVEVVGIVGPAVHVFRVFLFGALE